MKIGYVRVSKQEQHEALKEAGCEKWFIDKTTGSKVERNTYYTSLTLRTTSL
jgi:DNA invertase Pin-like site-specific DNA recombinase